MDILKKYRQRFGRSLRAMAMAWGALALASSAAADSYNASWRGGIGSFWDFSKWSYTSYADTATYYRYFVNGGSLASGATLYLGDFARVGLATIPATASASFTPVTYMGLFNGTTTLDFRSNLSGGASGSLAISGQTFSLPWNARPSVVGGLYFTPSSLSLLVENTNSSTNYTDVTLRKPRLTAGGDLVVAGGDLYSSSTANSARLAIVGRQAGATYSVSAPNLIAYSAGGQSNRADLQIEDARVVLANELRCFSVSGTASFTVEGRSDVAAKGAVLDVVGTGTAIGTISNGSKLSLVPSVVTSATFTDNFGTRPVYDPFGFSATRTGVEGGMLNVTASNGNGASALARLDVDDGSAISATVASIATSGNVSQGATASSALNLRNGSTLSLASSWARYERADGFSVYAASGGTLLIAALPQGTYVESAAFTGPNVSDSSNTGSSRVLATGEGTRIDTQRVRIGSSGTLTIADGATLGLQALTKRPDYEPALSEARLDLAQGGALVVDHAKVSGWTDVGQPGSPYLYPTFSTNYGAITIKNGATVDGVLLQNAGTLIYSNQRAEFATNPSQTGFLLQNYGTVAVANGSTLINTTGVMWSAQSRLTVDSTSSVAGGSLVASGGSILLDGSTVSGVAIGAEYSNFNGSRRGDLTVKGGAAVSAPGLYVGGGDATVVGASKVTVGAAVVAGSPLDAAQAGRLSVSDVGTQIVARRFDVGGTNVVDAVGGHTALPQGAGEATLEGGARVQVTTSQAGLSPSITVFPDSQLDVSGGSAYVGNATPVWTDGTLTVGSNGYLMGSGTIVGNVVNDGGTVDPGLSPGTLTIDGVYRQLGSTLNMEIGIVGDSLVTDRIVASRGFSFEGGFIDLFVVSPINPMDLNGLVLFDGPLLKYENTTFRFGTGLEGLRFDPATGKLQAVPEPATLVATSLALLAIRRRRRA